MDKNREAILQANQRRIEQVNKAFGNTKTDDDLEKAVYTDNAENRRLNRVGQTWGGEGKGEQKPTAGKPKITGEQAGREGTGDEGDGHLPLKRMARYFNEIDKLSEDWNPNDTSELEAVHAKVTKLIKTHKVTKKEFMEVASKFKGLDLIYSDYRS